MFMRTMSAFTVAFALTATTLPAAAQQSRTFPAWGHEFVAPEIDPREITPAAPNGAGPAPLRSNGRTTAYTASSGQPATTASTARNPTRAIDVRGARFEVPAR